MNTKIKYYALKLKNKSPMHISQNHEVFVEKSITNKGSLNVRAKIPATALAGVFRSWCVSNRKEQLMIAFFGTKEEKSKNGYDGITWSVEDGYSMWKTNEEIMENRYYKPISNDYEIFDRNGGAMKSMIISDTEFRLDMELQFKNTDAELILRIEHLMEEFLSDLELGKIYIGSKVKDGLGQLELVEKAAQSFDMTKSLDLEKYIGKIPSSWNFEICKMKDSGDSMLVNGYKFKIDFPHGLKISKDQTSLVEEDKKHIIYASSQRGFLKSYFKKMNILFKTSNSDELDTKAIDILFGTEEQEAKLKLKDIYISEHNVAIIQRCKLNDLTLEPMSNSCFKELILKNNQSIDWDIDLSKLSIKEWAMVEPYFLCLIMDLVDEKCSLGGGVTNGYGLIRVESIERIVDGNPKTIFKAISEENNGGIEDGK